MLKPQIQDWMWGFLAGILLTFYVLATAFQYLPSPTQIFDDAAAECREHPAINKQEEPKPSERGAENNPSGLQSTEPYNLKKDTEAQKHEYDCLVAKYTGNLALFTRWLVAATATLALFGLWQVVISRNTARRQLRAYVFSEPKILEVHTGGSNDKIVMRYETKNWGQTPAYELRNTAIIQKLPWPLPKGFRVDMKESDDSRMLTLGPGQVMMSNSEAPYQPVGDDYRYYVGGLIYYLDAFGKRRTTRFCYSCNVNEFLKGISPGGERAVHFEISPQHNSAD
jgi:hypothetical protein